MSPTSFHEIIPVLQTAIGPVILISGKGNEQDRDAGAGAEPGRERQRRDREEPERAGQPEAGGG